MSLRQNGATIKATPQEDILILMSPVKLSAFLPNTASDKDLCPGSLNSWSSPVSWSYPDQSVPVRGDSRPMALWPKNEKGKREG